jgi:hypothetical protein
MDLGLAREVDEAAQCVGQDTLIALNSVMAEFEERWRLSIAAYLLLGRELPPRVRTLLATDRALRTRVDAVIALRVASLGRLFKFTHLSLGGRVDLSSWRAASPRPYTAVPVLQRRG